jgi:hypothetical protein
MSKAHVDTGFTERVRINQQKLAAELKSHTISSSAAPAPRVR